MSQRATTLLLTLSLLALVTSAVHAQYQATDLSGYISVQGDYLVDDSGWQYGMNFYVSNGASVQACIYPRVTEANNVAGSVTSGPVLLQPGESGVNIGQYIAAVYGEAWSVAVEATADDGCY
jgi:hypothetical protein